MSVVMLVADGARPDTIAAAMDAGQLPAIARLRAEGHSHTVTSTFPSVTGPAYAPFLLGRYPAPVGLPALRWFDRARSVASFPHYTRSYVGHEMRKVDEDLDPTAPTLFELAPPGLGALNVIGRGLPSSALIGRDVGFVVRAASTHFRGNVRGWLQIDRDIGARVVQRIVADQPRVTFCALTGIDKTSHAEGHAAPVVLDAMRIVDQTVADLRSGLERAGRWEQTRLWIVSDHGHSPVRWHEDLAGFVAGLGHGVLAHPWVYGGGRDVAVMVSGNAMAHLYLELGRRERPWWPALGARWDGLVEALLDRPSVDVVLLPHGPDRCEVRARGRGRAFVVRDGRKVAYHPESGDPLGIGELRPCSELEAYDACVASDYPDAVVQIAHLAGAARCGEVVLSAARDWDFRSRYEPIPHVSSHGALHREHMLVPLIGNHPITGMPRRTVDVFSSALAHLGVPQPGIVDGQSFL